VFILGLALVGAVVGFVPRWSGRSDARLARFLALFSVALFIGYTLVPYKQPWLLMGPLHGLILLAGIGAAALWRSAWRAPVWTTAIALGGVGLSIGYVTLPYRPEAAWTVTITVIVVAGAVSLGALTWLSPRGVAPVLVSLALLTGIGHLAYQTRWASTRFAADQRNPLSHAQTSLDIRRLIDRVNELAAHHDPQQGPMMQVVAPTPWPLSWYLRRFKPGQIGYLDEPSDVKPRNLEVPMLLVDMRYQELVAEHTAEGYESAIYGLRPGRFLRLYVEQSLWQRFMADRR
jgi:hypothetical protein